jgi:hypothetical protein
MAGTAQTLSSAHRITQTVRQLIAGLRTLEIHANQERHVADEETIQDTAGCPEHCLRKRSAAKRTTVVRPPIAGARRRHAAHQAQ